MSNRSSFLTATLVALFSLTLDAAEKDPAADTWMSGWKPYCAERLMTLAEKSSLGYPEQRSLMKLVLQAGIAKDGRFKHLLNRRDLRKTKNVDLALSAYDYMVSSSEAALDHILAQLATEDIGADVDTIVVLSFIDEWDRTVRAFRKHFVRTDGAGGTCKHFFQTTRKYLYPKKYEKMRAALEAPVEWNKPLLPQE